MSKKAINENFKKMLENLLQEHYKQMVSESRKRGIKQAKQNKQSSKRKHD